MERSVKSYTKRASRNDKLDGNFTLYYPASNSDSSRFFEKLQKVRSEKSYFSWKNLKKIFSGSKVDPNEIKVTNHLRLEAKFQRRFSRRTLSGLLSPGKVKLSNEELLKEDGVFSDLNRSKGQLISSTTVLLPPSCRTTGCPAR